MPRFMVKGAHSQTGLDVEQVITANSADDAERIAHEHSILVASIELEAHDRPSTPATKSNVEVPRGYKLSRKTMVCPNPNCGYRGNAISKPKGNLVVVIVLLLLWILPGLIYLIFFSGYRYFCPECKMEVSIG